MADGDLDRAPHGSAQGDVLMGENAYFVEVGARSPHSYIADTCATCHMALTDPPADLSNNLAGTNHTFEASRDICTQCHGAFDGGSLMEAVEQQAHQLELALLAAIVAEIDVQTAAGNTLSITADEELERPAGTFTTGAVVTAAHFGESHGRMLVDLTVDGTLYAHVDLNRDLTVGETGFLANSDAGTLIHKAGWNYTLIANDGSDGVHNPDWAIAVLRGATDALK